MLAAYMAVEIQGSSSTTLPEVASASNIPPSEPDLRDGFLKSKPRHTTVSSLHGADPPHGTDIVRPKHTYNNCKWDFLNIRRPNTDPSFL